MAYRFLLEVPEVFAADAGAVIDASGVGQVIVTRPSHGLGIDDAYRDLTVATHDLAVINTLYAWYADLQANRPESRTAINVVLHGGRRFGLHEVDADQTIAAIERDQPWVSHTTPMIRRPETSASAALAVAPPTTLMIAPPSTDVTQIYVHASEGTVHAHGGDFLLIGVMDLEAPEHFYVEIFGMTLLGRQRILPDGRRIDLPIEYDHQVAAQRNEEADLAFLAIGPVQIALQRRGRAYPLAYGETVNDITLRVAPSYWHRVKASVLMGGHELLESTATSFTLRDPSRVAWQLVKTP